MDDITSTYRRFPFAPASHAEENRGGKSNPSPLAKVTPLKLVSVLPIDNDIRLGRNRGSKQRATSPTTTTHLARGEEKILPTSRLFSTEGVRARFGIGVGASGLGLLPSPASRLLGARTRHACRRSRPTNSNPESHTHSSPSKIHLEEILAASARCQPPGLWAAAGGPSFRVASHSLPIPAAAAWRKNFPWGCDRCLGCWFLPYSSPTS
jgi:hypothetical protein